MIATNVALYNQAMEVLRANAGNARLLRDYLAALPTLFAANKGRTEIGADEFVACLSDAFTVPLGGLESVSRYGGHVAESADDVIGVLARQVDDLDALGADGSLSRDLRYVTGLSAPSGHWWVNFDTATFIECGLEGAFGGWTPEANSSRQLVPGDVMTLDENGKLISVPAHEIPTQIRDLAHLTWRDLGSFAIAGQTYE